jgi:recombination protein RecR
MPTFAAPLERVILELAKLPGIGRKTAQRLAFHLLDAPASEARALAESIVELRERIRSCSRCFNVGDAELCPVCADPRRDGTTVCVVEQPSDVAAFERAAGFRGAYHVLGGSLSPLRDVGPDDLHIRELLDRVGAEGVREVILATSPSVEGEATAVYLARLLKPLGVGVSRLAQGLPAGASLEFTDDLTLRRALEGRREY